jgi:hypothetical protein
MANNTSNNEKPIKNSFSHRHMFPYIMLLKELDSFMKECVRDDIWNEMTKDEAHRKMAYISANSHKAIMRLTNLFKSLDEEYEEFEFLNLDEFLDNLYLNFPESEWEIDYVRCDDSFDDAGFDVPRLSIEDIKMKNYSKALEYVNAEVNINYESLYCLCESIIWNAIYNGFADEDKAHEVKIYLSANASTKMYEIEFVSEIMPNEHPLDDDCERGFSTWREAEMKQILERHGGKYEIDNNGKLLFVRIYLPFIQA